MLDVHYYSLFISLTSCCPCLFWLVQILFYRCTEMVISAKIKHQNLVLLLRCKTVHYVCNNNIYIIYIIYIRKLKYEIRIIQLLCFWIQMTYKWENKTYLMDIKSNINWRRRSNPELLLAPHTIRLVKRFRSNQIKLREKHIWIYLSISWIQIVGQFWKSVVPSWHTNQL